MLEKILIKFNLDLKFVLAPKRKKRCVYFQRNVPKMHRLLERNTYFTNCKKFFDKVRHEHLSKLLGQENLKLKFTSWSKSSDTDKK